MSEFGHNYAIGDGFCIDSWGAGPFVIHVGAQSWRFEDSDRFGPSLVKKNGDDGANPFPPERSPFWVAHFAWCKQGRRIAEDGVTCVWEPLKPTLVRIVRRQIIVIEEGDPDGDMIDVADGKVIRL